MNALTYCNRERTISEILIDSISAVERDFQMKTLDFRGVPYDKAQAEKGKFVRAEDHDYPIDSRMYIYPPEEQIKALYDSDNMNLYEALRLIGIYKYGEKGITLGGFYPLDMPDILARAIRDGQITPCNPETKLTFIERYDLSFFYEITAAEVRTWAKETWGLDMSTPPFAAADAEPGDKKPEKKGERTKKRLIFLLFKTLTDPGKADARDRCRRAQASGRLNLSAISEVLERQARERSAAEWNRPPPFGLSSESIRKYIQAGRDATHGGEPLERLVFSLAEMLPDPDKDQALNAYKPHKNGDDIFEFSRFFMEAEQKSGSSIGLSGADIERAIRDGERLFREG